MSEMFTFSLSDGLLVVTLYLTHMCIHVPHKPIKYLAYMGNLVVMYVSDTNLAIMY